VALKPDGKQKRKFADKSSNSFPHSHINTWKSGKTALIAIVSSFCG